jgi:molybdate transport system permease protein
VSRPGRALPAVLLVPAAVAGLLLAAPLAGLLARAPWDRVLPQLRSTAVLQARWRSLQCSTAAALLSLLLGLPLAAWLARARGRAGTLVRVLVTLPMVLPPVVGGVALLLAFGRHGLLGGPLGLELPFSVAGVILAETFVAMPFLVLTVEGGLRSLDPRYADAASTLGATPWRAFRTVTLPMIAPSIRAGLLLAWARALGEFGATITFAGNLGGRTRTMPLAVYVALENDPDAAIVLSLLLMLVCATVLWALRRQWFPLR